MGVKRTRQLTEPRVTYASQIYFPSLAEISTWKPHQTWSVQVEILIPSWVLMSTLPAILYLYRVNLNKEKAAHTQNPSSWSRANCKRFWKVSKLWQPQSTNVNGHQLTTGSFADDIVLFATSPSELEILDLSTATLEVWDCVNELIQQH